MLHHSEERKPLTQLTVKGQKNDAVKRGRLEKSAFRAFMNPSKQSVLRDNLTVVCSSTTWKGVLLIQ